MTNYGVWIEAKEENLPRDKGVVFTVKMADKQHVCFGYFSESRNIWTDELSCDIDGEHDEFSIREVEYFMRIDPNLPNGEQVHGLE